MQTHTDQQQDGALVQDRCTYFGRSVEFRGKLAFDGAIRIDGRLEGEIHTEGMLEVGETGVLQGIIHVGTLISSGTIKGTVTATSRVHLHKTSVSIGEISTPSLSIDEGAHLQELCNKGACRCADQENQDEGLGPAVHQTPLEARSNTGPVNRIKGIVPAFTDPLILERPS